MDDEQLLAALAEPENDRQWKLAAGTILARIDRKADRTNGRVTRLERFMYITIGGFTVVAAVIVPLFIRMVERGL